jgi:cystathionine beta-lyase
MYNFDKIVDRENTSSLKYDFRQAYFGKDNVLPMWVADMDFETPDFIRDAVVERAKHPIYGYSVREDGYYQSIADWVKRRHNWKIQKEWIVHSPGIVPALNFSIQSFTLPGDAVIVQPPVYFPFFLAINDHQRIQLTNPLLFNGQSYHINFDELEQQAKQAKMLFLSNPHNPVGRCFRREELFRIGEICLANDVLIVSDEIHNDLILPGFKHTPIADLSDELAEITITCIAPSKTFNLAGLATSSVIIKNEELRTKFTKTIADLHLGNGNLFGAVASQAAYTHGDRWLDELMEYINSNFQLLDSFLQSELPFLKMIKAEATYLAWIDFSATGLTDEEIREKLVQEAGLGFSQGSIFGPGGEGFQRMNLAAPRATVRKALESLKSTFT